MTAFHERYKCKVLGTKSSEGLYNSENLILRFWRKIHQAVQTILALGHKA